MSNFQVPADEAMRDAILLGIEDKNLQFLLIGKEKEDYKKLLKKSKEYKDYIRSLKLI